MKVYGLTGGIGMGKSTAAGFLHERGIPVVDTDELARQLVQPGQPALAEITAAFGAEILSAAGELRREELARLVFADAAARKRLEAILHPRIRDRWLAQIVEWRTAGSAAAVVVIPLLFETGAESNFDKIICVACSAATQRERLLARGWTAEQISQRIAAQWPVEKKMALAHHVVWTEGDSTVLAAQLARIIA
ncbi:MAG: dephospho-CoA kinase [Verrucomicrobia bacterium]|nr:dephospho-CoA kinase [Verrucomicrobiota bacterium]